LNPLAIKDLEKQIKKATDEGDVKKVAQLKSHSGRPVETLEVNTVTKEVGSDAMAVNFFDMLIERY